MRSKLLATIITAAVALFAFATAAHAQGMTVTSKDSVTVPAEQTIDGAYYASGNTITIQGTINGDLYCAGQTVILEGKVAGDVLCAGQTLQIGGEVEGDIRVAGQTIDVTGNVKRGMTAFGQSITIQKDAVVNGDINGAGANVTINGTAGRDVLIGGETMAVYGVVSRNLEGEYKNLSINDGAKVLGSVNYSSEDKASIADGAVSGKVNFNQVSREHERGGRGFVVGFALYSLVSLLLLALVLVLIAPQLFHRVTGNGVLRLGMSILVGFFVLFATPFIAGLIMLTIIGIPLAMLLLLAWIVILALSGPLFGYYIGRLVMRKSSSNPVLIMAVGSLILILSYFVPILNVITIFAALVVGSGMAVLELTKRYERPRYNVKV